LLLAAVCLGAGPLALAADPDCARLAQSAPKNLEGQVTKVDAERGTISVRTGDGTIHEFRANKETLQDYKNGDTIKANLRTPPECATK
jgi:hypothetical protein